VVSVLDGRGDRVFWARFEPKDGGLARASEDVESGADEMARAASGDDIVVADTLGNAKSPLFALAAENSNVFLVDSHPVQRGAGCAAAGRDHLKGTDRWTACSEIAPRYLSVTTMEKKLQCAS
jgi:hypothetical protein